jgi:hypothetical protein
MVRSSLVPGLCAVCVWSSAWSGAAAGPQVDFAREVLPVLSDACFQCHGPDAKGGRKGDLRLDEELDAKRDRGGFRVIAEGDPDQSALWQRVVAEDEEERMPPPESGKSLTPVQKETLRRWIAEGAVWGRHWAFEPVRRPGIGAEAAGRHPVDVLVERRLAAEGIVPNPPAPRETALRRVTLDLTGLPPTPAEIEAFRADDAPGAWERVVDRLLASSAYGERMAWEWLEAARYADSNGYQGDLERTMWPWRDWVVRAFRENLPFDRFTVWQLAGDLLPGATPDQILATAFNRNHMINGEGGRIPEENRVDYVFDMTETMGTVWLGLTLNCSRCHDHKFDPLTQREYYQLTAFFNRTPVEGGGGNPQTPPVLDCPGPGQAEAEAVARAGWEALLPRLTAERPAPGPEGAPPEDVAKSLDTAPASRKAEDWDRLAAHFRERAPAYAALLAEARSAKDRLDAARAAIPKVMVMADRKEPRPTYLLDRGLYTERREEVSAAVPAFLPPLPAGDGGPADRLDLARWLVAPEHPLTARVTVNRWWQQLFGTGLVKTAEDFGLQAEVPVHPELLDWLAAEFVASGWDVRALLRTIVTSETYRRSSVIRSPEDRERDPENRLLARGPRFRMPSWMIRDQALAAAGLLRPEAGGPPVRPYQPDGVWEEATFGKKVYRQDAGEAVHRRSLYVFWRRIVGPTMFFDAAKRQVCEVKPLRTNTPMHALATLNDVTYVEAGRVLAEAVLRESSDDAERMRRIGLRLLGREPTGEEAALWARGLRRARDAYAADADAARRFLGHGEAARDESLAPDLHAAWAALCLHLMNLDEALTKE